MTRYPCFLLCMLLLTFPVPVAAQPVEVPIVQRPYEHEAVQFGYQPWYVCNIPAFDSMNRPYIRSRSSSVDQTGYVQTIRHGRWVRLAFTEAVKQAYPDFQGFRHCGGIIGSQIVFDADDRLYTLLRLKMKDATLRDVLLYSADYGQTFEVHELPFGPRQEMPSPGAFNIEQRTGFNTLTRPPLLAILQKRADHPLGQWTHHYNLYLVQPRVTDRGLVLGEPVHVTDHALYMSRHAGNPGFAASAEDETFFVYAETTENNYIPGVPTFIATFDPARNEFRDRQFVGYGYPPNDGHNSPGIVRDSKGYLHTLTGSHGEDFFYARSLEPDSTRAGMTRPIPTLETGWKQYANERGRQCYLSFVCGADDTLHTVFRQWLMDSEFNGKGSWFGGLAESAAGSPNHPPGFEDIWFGALSHQSRRPGKPWDENAQLLIVPPIDGYAIYDQNLAVDRTGRLFVSYSYRSDQGLYYDSMPGYYHYRAVLLSSDGGATWRLATTRDFTEAFDPSVAEDAAIRPAQLVGRVADADGRPLAGVTVTAGPLSVTADQAGSFNLDLIESDQFELEFRKDGFQGQCIEVNLAGVAAKTVNITLVPAVPDQNVMGDQKR